MPYIRIPGFPGKLCLPENTGPKKHNCKDCFHCQWCPNDRCVSCLNRKSHKKSKSKKQKPSF